MQFVCPIPRVWAEIHGRLQEAWERQGSHGPPPLIPLILAGWAYTDDTEKAAAGWRRSTGQNRPGCHTWCRPSPSQTCTREHDDDVCRGPTSGPMHRPRDWAPKNAPRCRPWRRVRRRTREPARHLDWTKYDDWILVVPSRDPVSALRGSRGPFRILVWSTPIDAESSQSYFLRMRMSTAGSAACGTRSTACIWNTTTGTCSSRTDASPEAQRGMSSRRWEHMAHTDIGVVRLRRMLNEAYCRQQQIYLQAAAAGRQPTPAERAGHPEGGTTEESALRCQPRSRGSLVAQLTLVAVSGADQVWNQIRRVRRSESRHRVPTR